MKSAIIISGGSLNTAWLKEWLNTNKYNLIIAVDKGLEALDLLNIEADYIIGDFDSIDTNVLNKYNKNVIKLNPEKDFTDTHEGLKLAISLECEKVDIVGAIGTRIDHVLANINIYAYRRRLFCISSNNFIFCQILIILGIVLIINSGQYILCNLYG